jgi:hypothetical protein
MIFDVSHSKAGAKLSFNSMEFPFIVVRALVLDIFVPLIVLGFPDSPN